MRKLTKRDLRASTDIVTVKLTVTIAIMTTTARIAVLRAFLPNFFVRLFFNSVVIIL